MLGKLFSKILYNRLVDWAEKYGVYVEAQAGFRSNMGTADHMFDLHGLIKVVLILYADDIVLFANSQSALQKS